jgi:hypothetical protein
MTTLRSALLILRDDVLGTVWPSALSVWSKRAMRNSLWLAGMIVAASCAPSTATVRNEGARLLSCADVNVVWLRDLDYDAKGCGRTVSMRCDKASCRGLAAPSTDALSAWTLADVPVFATKNEPPSSCVAMGAAEGKDDTWVGGPKYEVALDRLRRTSYERGANYVTIDTVRNPAAGLFVGGRLFKCPAEVMTQAAPSPCVPDCSPGFVCVNASCRSACNPPCTATQQCGDDRICHAAR